jgi:hypothetical protein
VDLGVEGESALLMFGSVKDVGVILIALIANEMLRFLENSFLCI